MWIEKSVASRNKHKKFKLKLRASVTSLSSHSFEARWLKFSKQTPHIDAQASVRQLHVAQPSLDPRKNSISQPPDKILKIWLVTFLAIK